MLRLGAAPHKGAAEFGLARTRGWAFALSGGQGRGKELLAFVLQYREGTTAWEKELEKAESGGQKRSQAAAGMFFLAQSYFGQRIEHGRSQG